MALQVLKTGYDTNGINRLQPNVPEVFLHLRFKDPQDNPLDFPRDLPVIIEFGGNVNHRFEGRTQAGGRLRFTIDQNPGMAGGINAALPQASPLRAFTLVWDLAQMHYIVCDANSPPTTLGCTNTLTPGSPPYQANSRYFGLPRRWSLKQTDIEPAPTFGAGDGAWDAAKGTITLQRPMLDQDVGAEGAPVVLVFKLYWHFFRFEFFDRRWGHEPATHNNQRVSLPPIRLKGFRNANPAVADPAETDSNWTIPVAGSAAQEIVQCLPWMLRYNTATPRAALPQLTGANMGLLFETAAGTFVHCQSATNRLLLNIPANDARLDPKAERLDYYDLPRVLKSRGYYTRIGAGGKFFKDLTAAEVAAATAAADRLAFSLDDLVLTNDALAPILLEADHRVALFHHKFSSQGANYSDEGLFEPGADPDPTNWQGYPCSNPATVDMREARANYDAARAAGLRYYIHVYPNWTRLVLAQGNLFDVFDRRTPDGAAVVGARAAVRWVNATTGTYGVAPGNALARPNIVLKPANDARATFAIQTFYEQPFLIGYGADWGGGNPEAGPRKHIEWDARYGTERDPIGRFDIAVLRCTDRDGNNEVAALVRYHRLYFDFETADTRPQTAAANRPNPFRASSSPPPGAPNRVDWLKTAIDNMTKRWNGHDAPINTASVEILPRPVSPPAVAPALKVKVVNLFQAIQEAWAHYNIITISPLSGSAVGGGDGMGHLRVNCTEHDGGGPPGATDAWGEPKTRRGLASAHEMGHSGTLPDDYVADRQLFAHLNLLGAPYVFDERPGQQALMKTNWEIRARYFWHAAEWLRLVPALSAVDFKIKRDPGELDYFLPHYPRDLAPPTKRPRHFVNWPLSFNVWASHGGKSLFDAVLWILGEDKYSTDVLRNKIVPVRPGRVDGILIVMTRIEVDLSVAPGLEAETLFDFYTPIKTAVDNLLNFKHFAAFSLRAAGGDPCFTRCYLHFMVSMIQSGHALLATTKPHIKISFDPAASPPQWNPDASPPANAKTLRLQLPANFSTLAQLNRQNLLRGHAVTVRDRIVEALGLDQSSPANPMYYLTPSAYRGFIRAVTQPGIADPNVT